MIRTVVFDLGKVLFDFDYSIIERFAARHSKQDLTLPELSARLEQPRYERGDISTDAFLERAAQHCRFQVTKDEIATTFREIFVPITPMIKLAHALREHYQVLILSNTNELHWNYLCDTFQADSIAEDAVTSFTVRHLKPEAGIYGFTQSRYELTPHATVFIDDLAENADGARACGWHAIHHQSVANTKSALQELGVTAP